MSYVDKHLRAKREKSYRGRSFTGKQTDEDAKRMVRAKRDEAEDRYETTLGEEMDFFQMIRDRNETEHFGETQATRVQYDTYEYGEETASEDTPKWSSTEGSTLAESPDEESYNYEKFKMEYEQQLNYDVKHGKALNYTEKDLKDEPKKVLQRIIDLKRPKNCTKEELSQIGIKAIECLIYDYRRAKDLATMKKILSRTWLVLRVWLLIYVCVAIPCWCQRGKSSNYAVFS